jgi:hypothetical protein
VTFLNHTSEKVTQGLDKTVETMADTIIAVVDKLAGKESDVRLTFDKLTFDIGMMKATLNGSIDLDIVYAKDAERSDSTVSRTEISM